MVRRGAYKLRGRQLFDVIRDPKESNPIQAPEIERTLRLALHRWWNGIKKESAAFKYPLFLAGLDGAPSQIRLAGAAEFQNAIRGEQGAESMKAGARITLPLEVKTPGSYKISCQGRPPKITKADPEVFLAIQIGTASIKLPLTPKGFAPSTIALGDQDTGKKEMTLSLWAPGSEGTVIESLGSIELNFLGPVGNP